MTDVLIKRELLERAVKADASNGASSVDLVDGWKAMEQIRAILAAPRQPEGEGPEVVAWVVTGISSERARSTLGRTRRAFLVSQHDADQQHANWLPHYQSVTTDELCRLSDAQRAIAELREECERLGRTLYDRNNDLCACEAERDTLRQQRDKLAGLLLDARLKMGYMLYQERERLHREIDAALAEVEKK